MPEIPTAQVKPGYVPQSQDTSIDADVLMFQLLQQLTPAQKIAKFSSFNRASRKLALSGIRYQFPDAPINIIKKELLKRRFGEHYFQLLHDQELKGEEIVIADPIELAKEVVKVLDRLEIVYAIGSSVASSLWGENRQTADLELIVDISLEQAEQLILEMETDFYISREAVREAVRHHSSFNAMSQKLIEKVDFFVINKNEPFFQSKLNRRRLVEGLYVYSPEDIVLQKLVWYRLSREESQKQWRDVLGVLKVQQNSLDMNYLQSWAESLKTTENLNKALQQAGL